MPRPTKKQNVIGSQKPMAPFCSLDCRGKSFDSLDHGVSSFTGHAATRLGNPEVTL